VRRAWPAPCKHGMLLGSCRPAIVYCCVMLQAGQARDPGSCLCRAESMPIFKVRSSSLNKLTAVRDSRSPSHYTTSTFTRCGATGTSSAQLSSPPGSADQVTVVRVCYTTHSFTACPHPGRRPGERLVEEPLVPTASRCDRTTRWPEHTAHQALRHCLQLGPHQARASGTHPQPSPAPHDQPTS
jgi:hypothetical protein